MPCGTPLILYVCDLQDSDSDSGNDEPRENNAFNPYQFNRGMTSPEIEPSVPQRVPIPPVETLEYQISRLCELPQDTVMMNIENLPNEGCITIAN